MQGYFQDLLVAQDVPLRQLRSLNIGTLSLLLKVSIMSWTTRLKVGSLKVLRICEIVGRSS